MLVHNGEALGSPILLHRPAMHAKCWITPSGACCKRQSDHVDMPNMARWRELKEPHRTPPRESEWIPCEDNEAGDEAD